MRLTCGAAGLALVFTATVAHPDTWAPGTSVPPWPLIATLQRPQALGADRDAWQRAFQHSDPLVRAAAVWAAGRTRVRGAVEWLRVTAFDSHQIVREASLWALLQLDDAAARPVLWEVLRTRHELTRAGMSPSTRHVGEPAAGLGALFRGRGLPLLERGLAARREWLMLVPPDVIDPVSEESPTPAPIRWLGWTLERSEWDASERVRVRATVAITPTRQQREPLGSLVAPQTSLVALDEPDSGPSSHEEVHRIPVRLRRVSGGDGDVLTANADGTAVVELQLSLQEIPPGRYALEPFEAGHPLLLRVRRSSRRESEVQATAAVARTSEEIDAVSRQRVAAQADRWRGELAAVLEARGPMPSAHLSALARLQDGEAARLLVEAVSGPKPLRDGYSDVGVEHPRVRAFDEQALPHVERAAARWRSALDGTAPDRFALSVLRSVRLVSPTLDDIRIEAIRELGPRAVPRLPGRALGLVDAYVNEGFLSSLVAVTARRPREAGQALAAISDRPALLTAALSAFDPPSYTGYPYAPDLDGVETMLREAWSLMHSANADSRAAIAAEAERLSIELPGMDSAMPASAAEAVRELQRNGPRSGSSFPQPWTGPMRTLRRIQASGLVERDGSTALAAAHVARALDLTGDAMRLAELAVTLMPLFPDRTRALLARADAFADAGDAARAVPDLDEALAHLKRAPSEPEILTRREALAAIPSALRVRRRPTSGGARSLAADGRAVLFHRHVVFRREADGARRLVGVVPFEIASAVPVGRDAVAVISSAGSVGLVREGLQRLAWRRSVPPSKNASVSLRLLADERTVLVSDGRAVVHAFDARTGKQLWSRASDVSVPLALHDGDPVVLATGARDYAADTHGLIAVDARTGRALWTRELAGPVQAVRIAAARMAWLMGDGTLTEVSVRTGRPRFSLALPQPKGAQPGTALAIGPGTTQIVVALSDRLMLIEDGKVEWSRETPAAGSWTPKAVEVGQDDVIWRVVTGNGPVLAQAWNRSGDLMVTYEVAKWGNAATSITGAGTLALALGGAMVFLDRVVP